jgi:hypothetical protein
MLARKGEGRFGPRPAFLLTCLYLFIFIATQDPEFTALEKKFTSSTKVVERLYKDTQTYRDSIAGKRKVISSNSRNELLTTGSTLLSWTSSFCIASGDDAPSQHGVVSLNDL